MGYTMIIDNRGGGSGNIATEAVARADPDGYTLGYLSKSNLVINPHVFRNLGYDPVKSFEPITLAAAAIGVLAVHPSQPMQNLEQFIAWAKANPGKMTVASNGPTDPTNIVILLMNHSIGLELQPVYYKGGAPAVSDFTGGHVPAIVNVVLGLKPLAASGKARLLAVSKANRSSLLPDVPTFAELGYPGVTMEFGAGLLAPAGTPKPILDRLYADAARILAMPEVVQRINTLGNDVIACTPGEFKTIIQTELEKWRGLVKILGWKQE